MDYKILKVAGKDSRWPPKPWSSQYGEFVTYTLIFEDDHQRKVQWNRKASSDPPKAGDTVYGNLTFDASFNVHKFKTESRPQGGEAAVGGFHKKAQEFDSRTMYCAYAKDVVVAMIKSIEFLQEEEKQKRTYEEWIKAIVSATDVLMGTPKATPVITSNDTELSPEEKAEINSLLESEPEDVDKDEPPF